MKMLTPGGMPSLLLQVMYFFLWIRYPNIKKHRGYALYNYFSSLLQTKYFFKDYFARKKYKVIEYHAEFQQELTSILPFAYWHFLNGTLQKTISCQHTKELYFFSENHEEKYEQRESIKKLRNYEIPNARHNVTIDYRKWARVPLKKHYQNNRYTFAKPLLIIANKYNTEWNQSPINFLDIPILDNIISAYKEKYQIVYNRPLSGNITLDNSELLDLNEYAWLREKHPEVLLMNDLYSRDKAAFNNYNHFQLVVYANCSHFISVHGGTAALASYFEGINIVFSKKGIEHSLNEFSTLFPSLSGAKILHAKTEGELFQYLQDHY